MKNFILFILILLFSLLMIPCAVADDIQKQITFNWDDYTYEELLVIQEELNSIVQEKQREWAIENGNRVIDFDITDLTLYTTQNKTIVPSVTRIVEDAPETTTLIWTSSDESVARVSAAGVVTGVSMGNAEITCKAADDEFIFKTANVNVVLPVTAVSIPEPKITLLLSDKPEESEAVLPVVISPENAYCQDVTWSSSNETVATIDETGKVIAQAPGTTTITVSSDDAFSASYPKRATASVTVLQAVSGIELDQPEIIMNKNTYSVIKATVMPENASQKALLWESSDPSVVRVSNGQLTAVSTGDAIITCSSTDGSNVKAKSKIKVIQMVNNINFPNITGSQELLIGDKVIFTPNVLPEDASDKSIRWTSSDDAIATVDPLGIITAKSNGRATITCTAKDGSGKFATINLFIPSIGFNDKQITVTDRDGLIIDVPFYGDPKSFEVQPVTAPNWNIVSTWDSDNKSFHLQIIPSKFGSGTVFLKDNADPQNNRSFTLSIDHNAAYDTTSFPRPQYNDAMRYPEKYEGTDISIYGKVVQKIVSGDNVALRVATSWGWDDIFYVIYKQSSIGISIIENDWITVYGQSTGEFSYTAVMGNTITVPSMEAERIFIGNN